MHRQADLLQFVFAGTSPSDFASRLNRRRCQRKQDRADSQDGSQFYQGKAAPLFPEMRHEFLAPLSKDTVVKKPQNSPMAILLRQQYERNLSRKLETPVNCDGGSLHPLHVTPKPCRLRGRSERRDRHHRSLLAQFGLTPKSKRGLASSDPGEAVDPLDQL